MHHNHTSRRRPALAALSVIILALALAACGSSSPSRTSSTTASVASTSSSTATAPPAGFAGGFTALRECLSKHGVTLPGGATGKGTAGLAGLLGAGGKLPSGVSRSQYEAVLKVCGGLPVLRGGTRGFGRLRSPQYKTALTKFAECLREKGINLPKPNTSGSGAIFDTKGIDTKSQQYKSATAACASKLRGTVNAG